MKTMQFEAYESAEIAFLLCNPDASRDDWVQRNKAAYRDEGEDAVLLINDCQVCLTGGVLSPNDQRRDKIIEAMSYFKAHKEIIDELAADELVVILEADPD